MARHLTPEQVQEILNRRALDELVGVLEDEHLEFKGSPYQLQHNYQKLELAKDVSALANLSARNGLNGGNILLGVATEKSEAQYGDVVVSVSPYAQNLVDPAQYYGVLEDWLVPVPTGLRVHWFRPTTDETRGIVAITVPRQQPSDWPFLVNRVVDELSDRIVGHLVGYFERHRDGVRHYDVSEVRRLLQDGRRFDAVVIEQMTIFREEIRGLRHVLPSAAPRPTLSPSGPVGEGGVAEPAEPVRRGVELPAGPPSSEQHHQRRGAAVAAAGLNEVPTFALSAAPMQPVRLPTLFRSPDDSLVRLLQEAPGLRAGSFSVRVDEPLRIVPGGRLRRAVVRERLVLECWPDGTLIFAADAGDFICWGTKTNTARLRINPLALAESTYLFALLASRVYSEHANPQPASVEFSLAFYRMELHNSKAILTSGRRRSHSFRFGFDARPAPENDAVFIAQVAEPWSAGFAAYELLSQVYHWFGFDDDAMPYVVEVDARREISDEKIIEDGQA